jgi:hypothetical protein
MCLGARGGGGRRAVINVKTAARNHRSQVSFCLSPRRSTAQPNSYLSSLDRIQSRSRSHDPFLWHPPRCHCPMSITVFNWSFPRRFVQHVAVSVSCPRRTCDNQVPLWPRFHCFNNTRRPLRLKSRSSTLASSPESHFTASRRTSNCFADTSFSGGHISSPYTGVRH